MNNPTTTDNNTNLAVYCCFGLLWVLVIAVVASLAFLITDRERDHLGPESNLTEHNKTL